MLLNVVFEIYDGTCGFVAVGEEEARLVGDVIDDGRVPFMGTNARHKKYTPMIWVSDAEVGRVLRILTGRGHYVTFKGQKQVRDHG